MMIDTHQTVWVAIVAKNGSIRVMSRRSFRLVYKRLGSTASEAVVRTYCPRPKFNALLYRYELRVGLETVSSNNCH